MFNSCPLCKNVDFATAWSVDYTEIWRNLGEEWGAQFSPQVFREHTPAEQVELRQCSACGLQYFYPAVAGSDTFYAELTSSSPEYYNDEKWEFSYFQEMLSPSDTVVDIACGSGAFVEKIHNSAATVLGIDTNADAISKAVKKGLPVRQVSLGKFAQENTESFSVVTAFQVLEHVIDIVGFASAAYQCVAPGGALVVSVPNRDRRNRTGFESLDHPPHHLTRWAEKQLYVLADTLKAQVECVVKQPLDSANIIAALRQREIPSLLPERIYGRSFLIKAISRALLAFPLSSIFFGAGFDKKLSMYGMPIAVVLRKPAAASKH